MILIDSCKGCGSTSFNPKSVNGTRFLTCNYCGGKIAILEPKESAPISPFSGMPVVDYFKIPSGITYSGIPLSNNLVYSDGTVIDKEWWWGYVDTDDKEE